MLKIGVDIRGAEAGFKAHAQRGTGRYVRSVVERLPIAARKFPQQSIKIRKLGNRDLRLSTFEKRAIEFAPFGKLTLASQLFLPKRLSRLGLDLIHFFSHADAPARGSAPYLVSVLDLIPLKFPDLYKADKPNWRFHLARSLENRAIARARGVIAISETTKRDVVELLGVSPEKVFVTPLAADECFLPIPVGGEARQAVVNEARQEFGLPRSLPILLYVGGIDPRKNVPFLLEVFADLLNSWPTREKPLLVFAGEHKGDDQYAELQRIADKLGIKDRIRELGFVPDELLPDLYSASDVLLFPSLYEGFGLPPLEAMSTGIPVVAGDNSSIAEVVSSGGKLVSATDKFGWVKAIREVLDDKNTAEHLVERGLRRAAEYSWDKTAELTLRAYQTFV